MAFAAIECLRFGFGFYVAILEITKPPSLAVPQLRAGPRLTPRNHPQGNDGKSEHDLTAFRDRSDCRRNERPNLSPADLSRLIESLRRPSPGIEGLAGRPGLRIVEDRAIQFLDRRFLLKIATMMSAKAASLKRNNALRSSVGTFARTMTA